MNGDYSRDSFDALRDYAGVLLQQGRGVLDADWNEMVGVFERRIRAGTVDTIGRAVVPRETMSGFEIRIAGNFLEIGRGRKYLDGMLLECHGAANFPGSGNDDFADPVFDRSRDAEDGPEGVLDELISDGNSDFLDFSRQPYWPNAGVQLLPQAGPFLVYLVAWRREITPLQEPDLLEPALGGIDTATRWQTVWQVRVLPNLGANTVCATPDDQLGNWADIIAPSTARLTTTTIDIEDPEDPCLVPPTDGYTGIENQFYRVELHTVGDSQGDAAFKFSRENASVAASVETIGGPVGPVTPVTVRRIGRDEILRFRAGDWVEITDDRRELDHRSGQMLQVADVHEETRTIELEGVVDADLIPSGNNGDTPDARRSRIIRWDQRGIVRLADESVWVDLDAPGSDGLIPVPTDGSAVVLESGITVSFSTAPGAGGFREMDGWRFAARTAGTQIEELQDAPPHSVQRHYCRLAIVNFPNSVQDCRIFWPPEFGGETAESCGCTVCVTPDSHNSGALTIQAAIDQIGPAGGTVCLEGGGYVLSEPVRITGQTAITLRGQGMATVLLFRGSGSAIEATQSLDVQIERLSILAVPAGGEPGGNFAFAHGITLTNCVFPALRRLAVIVVAGNNEARQDHGIAINGVCIGAKTEECLVIAPVALGSTAALDLNNQGQGFVALAEIRALDNIFFGARAAIRFLGVAINVAGVTIARNLCLGIENGVQLNWFEPPAGSTSIDNNTIISNGDAAEFGVSDLRLLNNEISGGASVGNGVRLLQNVAPDTQTDARIVGNSISDLAGAGVSIEGAHGALLIKQNIIRRCGASGIVTLPTATIRHLAIDNNVLEEIAGSIDQQEAAAIILVRAETGRIAGNSIAGVGQNAPDGAQSAGISLQGTGPVAVEGNVFRDIGPDRAEGPAAAIVARPPFTLLNVQSNQIAGSPSAAGNATGWMAIEIGRPGIADALDPDTGFVAAPLGYTLSAVGLTSEAAGFLNYRNETYFVSNEAVSVVGPARPSQIAVASNQIHHGAPPIRPLVSCADTSASSIAFNNNQCHSDGTGSVRAMVLLAAGRITASTNTVRHGTGPLSMLISVGNAGAATPIGNITTSAIDIIPNGLNSPFKELNLFA